MFMYGCYIYNAISIYGCCIDIFIYIYIYLCVCKQYSTFNSEGKYFIKNKKGEDIF